MIEQIKDTIVPAAGGVGGVEVIQAVANSGVSELQGTTGTILQIILAVASLAKIIFGGKKDRKVKQNKIKK